MLVGREGLAAHSVGLGTASIDLEGNYCACEYRSRRGYGCQRDGTKGCAGLLIDLFEETAEATLGELTAFACATLAEDACRF